MLSPLGDGKKKKHGNGYGNALLDADTKKGVESSTETVFDCYVPLKLPEISGPIDPMPHLSSLKDNGSLYKNVTKSCFYLNLYASTQSTSTTDDTPGPDVSEIFHDTTYAEKTSSILSALMDCTQSHQDRRCRILACKTVANVGRSAYARIRHSPLLFSVRDGTLNRIEDEVGSDVAVTLSNVALDDDDDGVSACAVEALGIMTLSHVSTPGSLVDDEFLREVQSIIHARPSPYAPSLIALADEDVSVPLMELQCRIYENVMAPRLFRLICRITCYSSSTNCQKTLPFLTACLVHVIKTNPAITFGMDRAAYAKRWMEVDAAGMALEVVHSILLPSMQSSFDTTLSYTAALSGIRLAHVCPNAPWMLEVCQWAIIVLSEHLQAAEFAIEKTSAAAALLVALRAIPVSERVSYLQTIANHVKSLPSTERVPFGVSTPGVLDQYLGEKCYQRPARIGFWTDIALSLFLDGPVDGTVSHSRSKALNLFLMGNAVTTVLTSRSSKTHSKQESASGDASQQQFSTHEREELVLSFCMVASSVGKCVMIPRGAKPQDSDIESVGEWLRCSLSLLSTFAACLTWRSQTTDEPLEDEDNDIRTQFTLNFAAKASYLRLFQECLYSSGLINTVSSISFNVMQRATPPRSLFVEQLKDASASLLNGYTPASGLFDFAIDYFLTLADIFLEYKIREGLPSRHVRIYLLSLLTDHWVQQLQVTTASTPINQGDGKNAANHASANLNELNAQEILATLAGELSALTTVLNESNGSEKRTKAEIESLQQYLVVCVACVENIALTACEWKRRYGGGISSPVASPASSNDSFSQDIAEDADHLISVALAALRGRNTRDDDTVGEDSVKESDNDTKEKPLHHVCSSAMGRIQSTIRNDAPVDDDASWGIVGQPTLFSVLVMEAEMNGWDGSPSKAPRKMLLAPILTQEEAGVELQESPMLAGDAYRISYLAQHCQQATLSRIDICIRSSALADRFDYDCGSSGVYPTARTRPTNWLRLSLPPLPPGRFVPKTVDVGTRICWSCSTATVSACSDPISVMLAHAVRRYPRFDGETEFKLTVTIRMYNITPVEIAHGVRMDLRVSHQHDYVVGTGEWEGILGTLDGSPPRMNESKDILKSLEALEISLENDTRDKKEANENEECEVTEKSEDKESINDKRSEEELISPATILYKEEVKGGDHLTWEVTVDTLPTKGSVVLHPSVTFREIEVEHPPPKWVGPPVPLSDENEKQNKEEDDSAIVDETYDEGDEAMDVTLGGEPVCLSPMISLQPCPLVFYRDGCGDMNTFRFFWFNMPHRIQPLTLRRPESASNDDIAVSTDELGQAVARLSLLYPQDETTKAWAFMSLSGKRVLTVISQNVSDQFLSVTNDAKTCTLNARADDESLIKSLFGTTTSRASVVSSLTRNAWRCDEDLSI